MKMFLTKVAGNLRPTDHDSAEEYQKWHEGSTKLVTITEPRNPHHHRKLFALFRKVVENDPDGVFQTAEAVLTACKLRLGYVDLVRSFDGERVTQARSIAFENMSQGEFSHFYDGALKLCANYLGVDPIELETESLK